MGQPFWFDHHDDDYEPERLFNHDNHHQSSVSEPAATAGSAASIELSCYREARPGMPGLCCFTTEGTEGTEGTEEER